jgi:hypothetical protein
MAKAKSRINRRNKRNMRGGNTGYTFNQQDVIGGQMSRVGYSHCNNPDYFNQHKIYDIPKIESIPVPSSQVGGKRRSTKRRSTKKTKKSKRSTKRK